MRRAVEADTTFGIALGFKAWIHYAGGELDSLAALLPRLASALGPADVAAYEGLLEYGRGDYARAAARIDWRYYGGYLAAERIAAHVRLGQSSVATALVDSMLAARNGPTYFNPMSLSRAYAVLGDTARALEWLERAFDERTEWIAWIHVDPLLASLRGDPRYAAILRRYGVAPTGGSE